ncbi:MAG: M28 family peptidase [Chitinophagales bacterium]|jgi:hypothetical protein|nr:M28 family peptidase [Bacteroidota bacterium]MBK9555964.1 M28 family peptidase [Bacteroidota bacterium]MBP9879510.1 M28 family peptidase [Chitinophagales bacterium]
MKYSALFFGLLIATNCVFAQTEDLGIKYANTITASELENHLTIFASDYYEGRETGTRGLSRAADYLSKQFTLSGVPPLQANGGYFRDYPLVQYQWANSTIASDKNLFNMMTDFYGYAGANNSFSYTANDIVFLGYGIDDTLYSDYKNVDVKGKIVLIASGEPMVNGKSVITGSDSLSAWSKDWRKKAAAATSNGVMCLLTIDPKLAEILNNPQWKNFLEGSLIKRQSEYKQPEYTNNLFISQNMADKLLGKKKKFIQKTIDKISTTGKPANFLVKNTIVFNVVKTENTIYADNVLAFVEGTDLKEEVIVVSAHYDHLGKKDTIIYNGADDDGSGTIALLEISEAVAKAKSNGEGPRRSVLFIAFSGEEKGLLGSKAYADNPAIPFENTVANLNIDMIGRVDEEHTATPNYVYIIGSNFLSTALHSINEAAAKNYTNIELDYKYNSTTDPNRYYYRSDHYNFAKNNIPVIFYFNGTHEDYHQPTDDVEKINFPVYEARCRLVFHTLWILANQDARIKVDVAQED